MENDITEIVKELILIPTFENAVEYIRIHRDQLKTNAARNEFKKLLASSNLSADWAEQIDHFLEILDQLKTKNADAAVSAGMKKFNELITGRKSGKTEID